MTVKKAYDNLENGGFTVTVHGKGTYVTATNTELLLEEQKKEIEADLERAILAVGLGMAVFSDDISFTIGFMISLGSLFTVTGLDLQHRQVMI